MQLTMPHHSRFSAQCEPGLTGPRPRGERYQVQFRHLIGSFFVQKYFGAKMQKHIFASTLGSMFALVLQSTHTRQVGRQVNSNIFFLTFCLFVLLLQTVVFLITMIDLFCLFSSHPRTSFVFFLCPHQSVSIPKVLAKNSSEQIFTLKLSKYFYSENFILANSTQQRT